MKEEIIKQCPMVASNRDAEVHTDCIESRCAWWHGSECSILTISKSLFEFTYTLTTKGEG